MYGNPDDLSNQLIAKIVKHCKDEIDINKEHHWSTITDGTGDICRGRLEFAKSVLEIINNESNYFWNKQKGGAEAGFVAQLLFYPVTEQLFVFNEPQVRCVPAGKKNKKRY